MYQTRWQQNFKIYLKEVGSTSGFDSCLNLVTGICIHHCKSSESNTIMNYLYVEF